MNDLIRLAASRAVNNFGGSGETKNVFNGAGFSQEFVRMSLTSEQIDGHIVRMMLTGRPDIEVLKGGAHYRLVESVERLQSPGREVRL